MGLCKARKEDLAYGRSEVRWNWMICAQRCQLLLSYAAVQYIRFARAVLSIPEQVRMISISYMLWVRPQTQGRLTNLTAAITSNIAI
jgi:hypothetical protein